MIKTFELRIRNIVDCGNFHRLEKWLGGSYMDINRENWKLSKKLFSIGFSGSLMTAGRTKGGERNMSFWSFFFVARDYGSEKLATQRKSWQLKSSIPKNSSRLLVRNVKNPSNGKFITQALSRQLFSIPRMRIMKKGRNFSSH